MGILFDKSGNSPIHETVEWLLITKDVPPSIARKVYLIIYGGDGKDYTNHSDYLKTEQLVKHFEGKTSDEISGIVDKLSA